MKLGFVFERIYGTKINSIYLFIHYNRAAKLTDVKTSNSFAYATSYLAEIMKVKICYTSYYFPDMGLWNVMNEFCNN
jgi:hypothetical protein